MSFDKKQIRIAAIVPNGVEDMELIVPLDVWKRAKFIVDVIVYDTKSTFNMHYSGLKVSANFAISGINLIQYDLIYLPGGPGWKSYLTTCNIEKGENRSKLHESLIRCFDDENRWIAALCGAPVALFSILPAEKTQSLKFTCHTGALEDEIKSNWENKKVVVDKKVITGQNAGCSMDLALSVVEALAGPELAKEIADKLFVDYPGMLNYKALS